MYLYKVEVQGADSDTLEDVSKISIAVARDKFEAGYSIYNIERELYEWIYSIESDILDELDGYSIDIEEIDRDVYRDMLFCNRDKCEKEDDSVGIYIVSIHYESGYFDYEENCDIITIAKSKEEAKDNAVKKHKERRECEITRVYAYGKITSDRGYKIIIK